MTPQKTSTETSKPHPEPGTVPNNGCILPILPLTPLKGILALCPSSSVRMSLRDQVILGQASPGLALVGGRCLCLSGYDAALGGTVAVARAESGMHDARCAELELS